MLKYQHGDVLVAVTLGQISLFSCDQNNNWLAAFQEPHGISMDIHKSCNIKDLSVSVDWFKRNAVDGKKKRVFEDPVLSRR